MCSLDGQCRHTLPCCRYTDYPKRSAAVGKDCWNASPPGSIVCLANSHRIIKPHALGHLLIICKDKDSPTLRRSIHLTWLPAISRTWRANVKALFFQTSKFRPSHCQRQHTELNEAVGWTNMANRIALTTNMAHIMLNYGTRHDWTHITTGEVAGWMVGISNAM